MKKLSAVLALVLIFTFVFSAFANASGDTRTEKFFAEIEKTKAVTIYEPMKSENIKGISCDKVSLRHTEDENGRTVSEYYGSAKFFFIEMEAYATQNGMVMYFPQFNRHIDFYSVDQDKAAAVLSDLLYDETELMPLPSYPEYMSLKSSVVVTDVEGYGDLYVETFTYNLRAVVNDLVAEGIIPDPVLYDVPIYDNEALSDFYWNYAGDYSGYMASLLYRNEATFIFDENGMLLAADYFTGEGREVDNEYYELGEIGGFAAGAAAEDFEIPQSSKNLDVLTALIRFYLKLMVK